MWRQIPWVANGLTVQGGLELAWGLALLFAGADSDTKAPATLYEQLLMHVGPTEVSCYRDRLSLEAFALGESGKSAQEVFDILPRTKGRTDERGAS